MVPPQLFASMMEVIADQALVELAKTRLAQKAQAIEVDIDAL
jgi:antitoxin StbD